MNDEELESLLRQARPEGPPARWKQDILLGAEERRRESAFPSGPAWGLLAACWVVILVLRLITPGEAHVGAVAVDALMEKRAALMLAVGGGAFGEMSQHSEPKRPAPRRENPDQPTPPQAALELPQQSLS